jgi:hypothetical protein
MRVEDVSGADLEDLVDDLSDLRHDLGKYVTFGVRFLGPDPSESDLREALEGDLLRTARRPGGDEAAWQVWARLRPAELDDDPDVVRIDAGIAALRDADLSGGRAALEAAAATAREVADATRSLHRRAAARLD